MIMHKRVGGALAIFLLGAMTMANAQTPRLDPESFLPPAPVWKGASEKLIAQASNPWITPSEKTGLIETPNYDKTIAWLKTQEKSNGKVGAIGFCWGGGTVNNIATVAPDLLAAAGFSSVFAS